MQKIFISELKSIVEDVNSNTFEYNELKSIANDLNLNIDNFNMFIEKLNVEGALINKGNN